VKTWFQKLAFSNSQLVPLRDGVPEVVTGWSSGKLEVRNEKSGEMVYKVGAGTS
jgi:hypothetical protein